jgi:hypothetical protein
MNPLHEKDAKEFELYPAPIWETLMKMHPGLINATLPYYGPMLYWITRAIGPTLAVEIGVAEGYSSYFIANGVKDHNTRYNLKGKYIGIDINIRPIHLDPIKDNYPVEFWEMNSLDVKPEMFNEQKIHLLFQDGCHDTDHCIKELEMFYPLIADKGEGYIIMHDVYYLCEEYFHIIQHDERYNFEFVRLFTNCGLAICRKMDNYDYNRRSCKEAWVHGK